MVHRRELDGKELVLGNQGALYGNAMTWWDHDTGSIWSQPLGEAIAGPRKGARLELLPSTLAQWSSWRERHPRTMALDLPSPRGSFLSVEQLAIVVDFGLEAVAYPVPQLSEVGVVNDEVAGVPLAVVVDPADPSNWAVFSRTLDEEVVALELRDGRVVDRGTGTLWDPDTGRALEGPLAGDILDPLPAFTSFPADFRTFFPEGRIWEP